MLTYFCSNNLSQYLNGFSAWQKRNTCSWKWTEWTSCSSLCSVDGTMTPNAPEKRTREKVSRRVNVPQELCQGEAEEVCSPRPCISKSFVFRFTLKKKHESLPSPTCLWTMEHHQLLQRHMRKSSLLLEDEVHTVSLSYNTGNREKKQCNIQRTCIPALPNLPPGYSCENLEKSLTLSSSTTACEPFVPCRGEFLPQFE